MAQGFVMTVRGRFGLTREGWVTRSEEETAAVLRELGYTPDVDHGRWRRGSTFWYRILGLVGSGGESRFPVVLRVEEESERSGTRIHAGASLGPVVLFLPDINDQLFKQVCCQLEDRLGVSWNDCQD